MVSHDVAFEDPMPFVFRAFISVFDNRIFSSRPSSRDSSVPPDSLCQLVVLELADLWSTISEKFALVTFIVSLNAIVRISKSMSRSNLTTGGLVESSV
jgi:hypothetical protein